MASVAGPGERRVRPGLGRPVAELTRLGVERRVVGVGVSPRREAVTAPAGDPVAPRVVGAIVNGVTSLAVAAQSVGDPTVVEWTRRTGRAVLEVTEATLHVAKGGMKAHGHRGSRPRRRARRQLTVAAGSQTARGRGAHERHVAIQACDVRGDAVVIMDSGSTHEGGSGGRGQPPARRAQRRDGEGGRAGREPPRAVRDGCFLRHRRRLVSTDPALYEAATRKPWPGDEAQVGRAAQGKCVGI